MTTLEAGQAIGLYVIDELGLGRDDEPIEIPVGALLGGAPTADLEVVDEAGTPVPMQLSRLDEHGAVTESSGLVLLLAMPAGERARRFTLARRAGGDTRSILPFGNTIRLLDPQNADGYRRLDTGRFVLELCRGTGRGGTSSKWGIRHFEHRAEGLSLIKDDSNAIGGVFGPFFTPENGFVNPPEHAVAQMSVIDEGPLLCRYRLDVDVPDGLVPNLRGAHIAIDWTFFAGSHWFDRRYEVTPFETTVDSIPVANKITVGDEFEGGKGVLLFSRFAAWPSTVYRGRDPHSLVLFDVVRELLNDRREDTDPALDKYRRAAGGDLLSESYDFRWRLLSVREGLTPVDMLPRYLERVQGRAGEAMRRDIVERGLDQAAEVDVSAEGEETAFVRTADRTMMRSLESGYSVLWWTSSPVRRYQIVQSRESGWVNWGTNGENEYPELPSGSVIRMAYGVFDDPWKQLERMASPVVAQWTPHLDGRH